MLNTWPDFEQPAWLLLLLAVPPLIVWWFHRKPVTLLYPDTSVASQINTRRDSIARWCAAGGRGLGLTAAVLALAGPRWPDPGTQVPTEGIAILLIVDVSNSMNEEDFMWHDRPIARIKAMRRALHLLIAGGDTPNGEKLHGRAQDLVGLVTFTRRPKSTCPLTLSHDALLQMLEREETNKGGHDYETNVGDAIAYGIHRLNSAAVKKKVMILASDGEQGEITDALRPRQAAQLAAHFGIVVFPLDAGHDVATPAKSQSDQFAAENRANAKKALQDVARMTGGQYYGAANGQELMEACSKLDSQLDTFEREQIETLRRRQYVDGYEWFIEAAFVLWFAVVGLELTIWRKLP
jgi:Ca-activated chloride channel family protein